MVGYFRYCSEMIKKILFELYFKLPKATQNTVLPNKNSLPFPLKVLNGMKLIKNDQGITHTHLEAFRTFRSLLFLKQITSRELLL